MIYFMTAFFLSQAKAPEIWWTGFAVVILIELLLKKDDRTIIFKGVNLDSEK